MVAAEDISKVLSVSSNAGTPLQLHDLEHAIGLLPEEQWQVIPLVGLEGMGYEEVAAAFNIPIGTVCSRLSRRARNVAEADGHERGRQPAPVQFPHCRSNSGSAREAARPRDFLPADHKVAKTGAIPRGGAWLSLVERLLWEQDVGGSNPLAPTTPGDRRRPDGSN